MAPTLTLLLFFYLLQGVMSIDFSISMPEEIKILPGSCATIPCSFQMRDNFEHCLQRSCIGKWIPGSTFFNLTGNLSNKDCTTTLFAPSSTTHMFRLECGNCVKWTFSRLIKIKEDPIIPPLSQSTLMAKEGTSVNLTCSVSVFCVFYPPSLAWTPDLGDSQDTLWKDQSGIQVKRSTLTFTASYLHHEKDIFCTATFSGSGGNSRNSVLTALTANVSLAPKILPSSECTNSAGLVKCFCEAIGNPSPNLLWYFNGFPVNDSIFSIGSMFLNGTRVKSEITANKQQLEDLSKLLCRSTNALGSASQQFSVHIVEKEIPTESEGLSDVMMPVLIAAVAILLVLVCALLFVIRMKKSHQNLPMKCNTHAISMNHLQTNGDLNEAPNPMEEDIYVNTDALRQVPEEKMTAPRKDSKSSEPENAKKADTGAEDGDIIYSLVTWRSMKGRAGKGGGVTERPGSSYLLEESSMNGGMSRTFVSTAMEMGNLYDEVGRKSIKREAECEYAQVNLKKS